MSEVQKRVLAMMPELAGGKPKRSAVNGEEGEQETEETIQVNAVGQKVSTAARGKHDLLVKAKTGTGKTIVCPISLDQSNVLITGIPCTRDRIEIEPAGRDYEEIGRPIRRWSTKKGNGPELCRSRHHFTYPRTGHTNRQRSHQSLYMAQRT
jgi:hypothetical protein